METLRYPTLQAWADGICNAVRAKDGTADPIGHQDLPDRILAIQTGSNIDLSGITAQQPDVSERVQYIDATGELKYGTMPEITAETITLDGGNTECAIEEGHHGGSGKVRIVPETLYAVPSISTQELDSPAGKVYTKVILDPIPDIYKDVSGANATPAQVLQGSKFVGAAGSVEEGGIKILTGKRFTVTTNGQKSLSNAYYDRSAYFEVNVPQTIVSGSGEDSTNDNATSSDVRQHNDSGESVTFRAGGSRKIGAMPDVDAPSIDITKNFSNTGGNRKLLASASSAATKSGYLARGKTANNSLEIPVYCEYNGNNMTITPGKTAQYFLTAGKYLEDNLKVEAVENQGGYISQNCTQKTQLTISGITYMPEYLGMSLTTDAEYNSIENRIYDLQWFAKSNTVHVTCGIHIEEAVSSSVSRIYSVFDRITGSNETDLNGEIIDTPTSAVMISIGSGGLVLTVADGYALHFEGLYDVVWR